MGQTSEMGQTSLQGPNIQYPVWSLFGGFTVTLLKSQAKLVRIYEVTEQVVGQG